jgi:hypothetical protein
MCLPAFFEGLVFHFDIQEENGCGAVMADLALLVSVGYLIVVYIILPGAGIASLIMDVLPRSLNLRVRLGLAIATASIYLGFVLSSVFTDAS